MNRQREHLKTEIRLLIEKSDALSNALQALLDTAEQQADPEMGDRMMIRAITADSQPICSLLKRVKAISAGVSLAAADASYIESLLPKGAAR